MYPGSVVDFNGHEIILARYWPICISLRLMFMQIAFVSQFSYWRSAIAQAIVPYVQVASSFATFQGFMFRLFWVQKRA